MGRWFSSFPRGPEQAMKRLLHSCPGLSAELAPLWIRAVVREVTSHHMFESWCSQKCWSEEMDDHAIGRFDAAASTRLARLRQLQSAPQASAWLVSLPGEKDGCYTGPEWQALIRFRSAIPLMAHAHCNGCGTLMDPFGDHAVGCPACGLYARHNRIRNALAQECTLAGIRFLLEVTLPGSSLRPDDTLLFFLPEKAAPRAVDVSAVYPLHPSSLLAEVVPGVFPTWLLWRPFRPDGSSHPSRADTG